MREGKNEIFISSNPFEKRVALVEKGILVEFYVERVRDKVITGNIYKGRVVRVLPGMQSAFIDAGLARTAFLHVTDITEVIKEVEEEAEEEEAKGPPPRIQDILREGQEVMVQVEKEPIGTKGARVTSYISLPGRYLVLMPGYDKVAVSRRVTSDRERRRLKGAVQEVRPQGYGFIIRTVAEGASREELKADMDYLRRLWERIVAKYKEVSPPHMLFEELDLTLRTIRDLFTSGIDRVLVDSKEEHERILSFMNDFAPELAGRVYLYEGKEDIFDAHGIEIELAAALERKVWLRSGGFISIDQMEALTAVDVNTGKYVGKKSSDETIFKTNLEAVSEVVHQLRLRNIGGIIVIDFIDMPRVSHREKVYNQLKEALRLDKARTSILKISELGIVEMTRKRVRESLGESLCEPCPYCEGNSFVKAKDTVVMEIYRELLRELPGMKKKAIVYCSPEVAHRFEESGEITKDLEKRFGKKVVIRPVERFHQDRYEIF